MSDGAVSKTCETNKANKQKVVFYFKKIRRQTKDNKIKNNIQLC